MELKEISCYPGWAFLPFADYSAKWMDGCCFVRWIRVYFLCFEFEFRARG